MIRFERLEFLGVSSWPQSSSDHLRFGNKFCPGRLAPSSLLDSISDGLKFLIWRRWPPSISSDRFAAAGPCLSFCLHVLS